VVNENQLIFFTGIPGSRWSRAAALLQGSPLLNLNDSDRNESRIYWNPNREEPYPNHQGAYFGTGQEYGYGFESLEDNFYTKQDFVHEVMRPFTTHNNQNYLIKSHGFARSLKWITANFPNNRIIICLRELKVSIRDWYNFGGFEKIHFPNYSEYYKNPEVFEPLVAEEDRLLRDFIYENDLHVHTVTNKFCVEKLQIDTSLPDMKLYMDSCMGYKQDYSVSFAFKNCEDWGL
jgi:hypothetical protein